LLIRPFDPAAPSLATAVEGVVVAPDGARKASTAAAPVPAASRDAVEAAVRGANAALAARSAALQFIVDPDTRAVVVRLVDTADNQVLRQVPSEEMLAIAKAIDRMELTLLRNRA
jgi:flagellar protein FlaG